MKMREIGQYHGHAWTHRSEFQKTRDYGRINTDDCIATEARAIGPDSEDDLSDSERAAKRRRIERLAEGFLKGETLVISSARPCPQAVRRTVTWYKKSLTHPSFQFSELTVPPDSTQMWEEAEDDAQTLSRLLRSSKSGADTRDALSSPDVVEEPESVAHVTAQASCRPQRRLRPASISVGPSEEALQKAAALRNRKGRIATTEMTTAVKEPLDVAIPTSDPADCITVAQSKRVLRSQRDTRDWLLRRRSRFSFGGMDVRDIAITASSPCIASSSTAHRPLSRDHVVSQAKAPERRDDKVLDEDEDETRLGERLPQTATEDHELYMEPMEASLYDWDYDVQPKALHHQILNDPAAASARSFAPAEPVPTLSHDTVVKAGTQSAPVSRTRAASKQTRMNYLQAPSTQNGSTPLMYRKRATRPKGKDPPQDTIAPPNTRLRNRRRVTFPSSEDVQVERPPRENQHQVASHPTMLDMSSGRGFSFAPELNMALVEEHTNRVIPSGVAPEGAPTSIREVLRRELKVNGAVITRCDSEPPSSSQAEDTTQLVPHERPEPSSLDAMHAQSASNVPNSECRQTWLGTQAMVARAEEELFISPEKLRSAFTPINEQTPKSQYERSAEHMPASQEREPLKQLSQEPAPSTQAMLDTFGGFSTVKKPRSVSMQKQTPEHTPVAISKGKRPEAGCLLDTRQSSLHTDPSADSARDKRAGSQRFRVSSTDSLTVIDHDRVCLSDTTNPGDSAAEAPNPTKLGAPMSSASSGARRRSALKSSFSHMSKGQHTERQPSDRDETSFQSMSMFADVPPLSFQDAQAPDAPLALLRDTSNMSQTIDDLTTDVLGTTRE